ncbi:hypothetical protein [Rhodococcus sp. OK302]|uniref:hypothetical protein n=1 Tax=Rhodococcus sp. OK302 TaxID=1882769 RepID=UPI001595CF2B|nr:hypothetical protein [Rhodococcus sp. OK302]
MSTIVTRCTLQLVGKAVEYRIITNLAAIDVTENGLDSCVRAPDNIDERIRAATAATLS